MLKTLKIYWKIFQNYKHINKSFRWTMILGMIVQSTLIVGPKIAENIMYVLETSKDKHELRFRGIISSILTIIFSVGNRLYFMRNASNDSKLSIAKEKEVRKKFFELDYKIITDVGVGKVMTKINKGVDAEVHIFHSIRAILLHFVFKGTILIGMMVRYEPWLAVVMVATFVIIIFAQKLFANKVDDIQNKLSDIYENSNKNLVRCVSEYILIKLSNSTNKEQQDITNINRDRPSLDFQNEFYQYGFYDILHICVKGMEIAMQVYIGLLIISGTKTIAELALITSIIRTLRRPIESLLRSVGSIIKDIPYYKNLQEFLNTPKTISDGVESFDYKSGKIEIDHISFGYQKSNIFHILPKETRKKSHNISFLDTESLKTDGYVHCCDSSQVETVRQNVFDGRSDLTLLEIDVSKLESEIKYDDTGNGIFPHIYGKINIDAIVSSEDLVGSKNVKEKFGFESSETITNFLNDKNATSKDVSTNKDVVSQYLYEHKPKLLFQDFSMKIKGGKTTAIVGHSGSGKSTLIKLILRLRDANSGRILIDGQDLKKLKIGDFYSQIGYLSQEPAIFDGTVMENLVYGLDNTRKLKQKISDNIQNDKDSYPQSSGIFSEIHHIIKLSNCEFIYDLPNGLDTEIGERGVKLSGGEKQRIAIACIFLKNPKILILDEPTSALDSIAENQITQALNELMRDRTVIVIAHRLQTVQNADTIYVLEKGKIVEKGNHNELISQSGIYKTLVDLQYGIVNE